MLIKNIVHLHNVLQSWPLSDNSVDCMVTSPPYWGLRDYGTGRWEGGSPDCQHLNAKQKTRYDYSLNNSPIQNGNRTGTDAIAGTWKPECPDCGAKRVDQQLGQETTPEEYVNRMVQVFTEAYRVLKPTGTLWLNLGDTYWGGKGQSGGARTDVKNCELSLNADGVNYLTKGQTRPQDRKHSQIKPKDLVGIPWMVAFALRAAGWYLRSEIIWNKPNPMPESVTDRPTRSHEQLFLLTKSRDYYYDPEAIKEQATDLERPKRGRSGHAKNSIGAPGQKVQGVTKALAHDPDRIVSTTRNKRDVWTVTTVGFDGEYCTACGRYFDGPAKRLIQETTVQDGDNPPRIEKRCPCGQTNAWLSHFATFPPDLITDCIKAGSSQHGNCATCGRPWERVVEKIYKHHENYFGNYQQVRNSRGSAGNGYDEVIDTITKGWQPTCSCGTIEVMPAVVLDCFMGSGTSALVARQLGRDYVGLELNPHYIAMARQRLREGQQALISF